MPHLAWFYEQDEGESRFLGICEFTKRADFEVKLKALCVAYDWSYSAIRSVHCYDNSLLYSF